MFLLRVLTRNLTCCRNRTAACIAKDAKMSITLRLSGTSGVKTNGRGPMWKTLRSTRMRPDGLSKNVCSKSLQEVDG